MKLQESEPFLKDDGESEEFEHSRPRPNRIGAITLTALNVLLFTSSLALNWNRIAPKSLQHEAFPHEMSEASRIIEYEERKFTGALKYDPTTKSVYRELDAEREYVGKPSILLEDAWDRLLRDEFVPMTEAEAAPFTPELTKFPGFDQYLFEPDVTHTLHCVNAIRVELAKYMYTSEPTPTEYPESELAHLEHCIDRIRQSIMCAGDLTPSPLYTWPGFGTAFGRSDVHTCRKWQPIRDWMDERRRLYPKPEAS